LARGIDFSEKALFTVKSSRIHSDNSLNDLNEAQRLNDWNGFR
jgi:hypothetical protein